MEVSPIVFDCPSCGQPVRIFVSTLIAPEPDSDGSLVCTLVPAVEPHQCAWTADSDPVDDPDAFDDEVVVTKALTVPANPKRFVLGVAYQPDTLDGHGEFMSAEELERIAWEYCRKHRQIGFYHADGTLDHADVVESFIHRGPDWTTTDINGNEQVIKTGSWLLGALCDQPGFEQVVSQKADGWSMDGLMRRRMSPVPRKENE